MPYHNTNIPSNPTPNENNTSTSQEQHIHLKKTVKSHKQAQTDIQNTFNEVITSPANTFRNRASSRVEPLLAFPNLTGLAFAIVVLLFYDVSLIKASSIQLFSQDCLPQ